MKENTPELSYGHYPGSQGNLGGFRPFRQSISGGNNNLPHQIGQANSAAKVWLTYTLCYILALTIKFHMRLLAVLKVSSALSQVLDVLNFCS